MSEAVEGAVSQKKNYQNSKSSNHHQTEWNKNNCSEHEKKMIISNTANTKGGTYG